MRIKGVTRQWEGGGYYRIRQPLDELAKHGHQTSCHMAKSDIRAGSADVIVGQLIGGHNGKVIGGACTSVEVVHAWWRGLFKDAALVYELDDDPFNIEPISPSYGDYAHPVVHDSIKHCLEVSDLVTCSTVPLAERMSEYNKNVVVLPNRIDELMLGMERPKRDRLTIGWAGGETHIFDIMSAGYGLKQIMKWHKDIDVHFIGADLRPFVKTPRPIRYTPWYISTLEYYKNIDFDIGIAPLVPTVFAEAKSYIKALEYAALGIPVVASDTRPYRDFVLDGVTGFLVRREHEWARRLRDLINDEAMRAEMGRKAREVAAEYTIQTGWRDWETAYMSVAK